VVFNPGGGSALGVSQGFTKRVIITLANTEQDEVLTNVRAWRLKNDQKGRTLRLAYQVGDTTSDYITIYPYRSICREGISADTTTLRLRSDLAGHVVELEYWT
jgi:hypothetical protein